MIPDFEACDQSLSSYLSTAVILLQIVMVRPGTSLVKNHESQSRTNECQLKKQVQN